jgi:succinyl-CoA synthetase beta subunit
LDFSLLEMNPFCFNQDGIPVPLDVHAELDDTALFKNRKKWLDIEFPQPFGRRECPEEKLVEELDAKTGASLKLTVLNPKGKIWTMIAGGGASLSEPQSDGALLNTFLFHSVFGRCQCCIR